MRLLAGEEVILSSTETNCNSAPLVIAPSSANCRLSRSERRLCNGGSKLLMFTHRDAQLRFTFARASRVGYCLAFLALLASGCAQQRYITRRDQPNRFLAGPLAAPIASLTRPQPKPTPRTLQLLRRYDLVELQTKSPE